MKNKIKSILVIIVIISILTTKLYASSTLINNIFNQANNFQGTSSGIGTSIPKFMKEQIIPVVGVIGNLIFAGVTVLLGVKYIWSSAEGKAGVLESLPGFVIAVVFFYLAESLVNWLAGSSIGSIANASNWNTVSSYIWGIIYLIAQYGSFAGILYMGLRYMFASAADKASLKTNFGGLVIGIVFVFSASNIVKYIVEAGKTVIQ